MSENTRNFVELAACIASVERMIERAKLLSEEYDRRIRKVDIAKSPPVESLKYAITFTEVRSLDLLCKDALERSLPNHPEYAVKWFVNADKGSSGPEDLRDELLFKKQILVQALQIVQTETGGNRGATESEPSLPKAYGKLTDPVQLFFEDRAFSRHDYDKNVFIMTRFQPGNKELEILDRSIRGGLKANGLVGHRADDRVYPNDRNLWDNVCTYMICCKFGVAVLENIVADEFNPNVAMEYGFMRAMGKPTLLLKEKRFKPRADILGTVWEEFDMLNIETTVSGAIDRWLRDIGV